MSVKEPLQPNCNFAWVKADNTRLTKEELHNQRRQDMNEKPDALRLADWHESVRLVGVEEECWKAAAELRRLHAENERLREALEIIAGCRQCVDPLMGNQDVAIAALRREDKR